MGKNSVIDPITRALFCCLQRLMTYSAYFQKHQQYIGRSLNQLPMKEGIVRAREGMAARELLT